MHFVVERGSSGVLGRCLPILSSRFCVFSYINSLFSLLFCLAFLSFLVLLLTLRILHGLVFLF